MTKKAIDKHSNLIISLNKITFKKILEKHSKHKYGFSNHYFLCFLILLILPIGIAVKKLGLYAFKCIEKELKFGVKVFK